MLCTLAGPRRSLSSRDIVSPSRSPTVFSYEDLDDYFEGSKNDAAAYILNNVCIAYLDPAKNSPLSPLPSQHRQHHQHRLQSDTNPFFLDNFVEMRDNRCSKCHRFKKDPPSPDLGHEGSHTESKCKLAHHPFPCDFIDGDDNICEFHSDDGEENTQNYELLAKDFGDKLGVQNQELDQLKAEMLEMRRLVANLRPTASPGISLLPGSAQCSGSTITTVTTSITSPQVSVVLPTATTPSVAGNLPHTGQGSLASAAQELIHLNRSDVPGAGLPG